MVALNVGDLVAIKCWWGEHWGVVAHRDGQWTLVSNRGAKGMVTEEPLHEVVGAAEWRIVRNAAPLTAFLVVARARSKIGTPYNFWNWNCEDFVHWALGLEPKSPQRNEVVGVLTLACMAVLLGVASRRG